MKSNFRRSRQILPRLLLVVLCLMAFSAPASDNKKSLAVALYPYVPRIKQFKTTIKNEWARRHPKVSLKFLGTDQWDGGYSTDPPSSADVFVFDAIYFNYFRSQNYLEPLKASEVKNHDDFIAYARQGSKVNNTYYAIPQLGCASFLFYLKSDSSIANADTLTQLTKVFDLEAYTSQIPPDRRGLMIDMSGKTTLASDYLNSVYDINKPYPIPLPETKTDINTKAIDNLRTVLAMASYLNVTEAPDKAYQNAIWFNKGWGRAYVNYSESMSQLSKRVRSRLGVKLMPFSDNGVQQPLFYADLIGVNTSVEKHGTRKLAVELANLLASSETITKSLKAHDDLPPQYLLPTRKSVLSELSRKYPLYSRLKDIVYNNDPVMFELNKRSRNWFNDKASVIQAKVTRNPRAGCDYSAANLINNDQSAEQICSKTCSDHGGWTGQWTNEKPAAQDGSACGCNSCPSLSQE